MATICQGREMKEEALLRHPEPTKPQCCCLFNYIGNERSSLPVLFRLSLGSRGRWQWLTANCSLPFIDKSGVRRTLLLRKCQLELPFANQVFVVASLVC